MKLPYSYSAAKSYHSADIHGGVESANPHHLVEMLFDGLMERLHQAEAGIVRGEISVRCNAINKALSILDALRSALDFESGGNLATSLDDLYDYMQRRLVVANARSDLPVLKEVSGLLGDIRTAWKAVPPDQRSVSKTKTENFV